MNNRIINNLYYKGIIRDIDFQFGRFICGLCEKDDPDIFLGAALVSNANASGDVHLDLAAMAQKALFENQPGEPMAECPELSVWTEKLRCSVVVGKPGDFRPLILDENNRLYLYRYWEYERKLADSILKRAQNDIHDINVVNLQESMTRLFPGCRDKGIDWQAVAAMTAALKRFCVISGGPGTGKTYTVAKILALLLEQHPQQKLDIFLSAPTGKAAARLSESIKKAKETLECRPEVIDAIPTETHTIHRMLKTIPGSPYFVHNEENLLTADVVVVDEASMVDLALMSKLVAAVPMNARLILIGDKDQLASVEAGSVLGDICNRNNVHGFSDNFRKKYQDIIRKKLDIAIDSSKDRSVLQDAIVVLKKSFRFDDQSPIGALSRSVNDGDADKVLELFKTQQVQISRQVIHDARDLAGRLSKKLLDGCAEYLISEDPYYAFEQFNRFKILCAVNSGPFGVHAVNRLAEQILRREGLIQTDRDWYRGRPILVTRNDYNLSLYNGDMGITLPGPGSGSRDLQVYFAGSSGQPRRFPVYRLPEHETVYAMTVHKSQGSEFEDVVLILPDRDYPLLTRELFYTAITRARQSISVWGSEDVICNTLKRKIERTSGLWDALWNL
jgi:exodeoxyribonuclease V alpha subunit